MQSESTRGQVGRAILRSTDLQLAKIDVFTRAFAPSRPPPSPEIGAFIIIHDENYLFLNIGEAHIYTCVYCRVDRNKTGASGPRGGCARDFVNFREKNYAARV